MSHQLELEGHQQVARENDSRVLRGLLVRFSSGGSRLLAVCGGVLGNKRG